MNRTPFPARIGFIAFNIPQLSQTTTDVYEKFRYHTSLLCAAFQSCLSAIFVTQFRLQCIVLGNKRALCDTFLSLLYKYPCISEWPHRVREKHVPHICIILFRSKIDHIIATIGHIRPNIAVEWKLFLFLSRELPVSYLVPETSYPHWSFS
jgi:hypothetical protein